MSRAVVIGASIAGLLAARVLTDTYDEVVIVDRDFDGPRRRGAAQADHAHGMLASGLAVIEGLLPGFAGEVCARGGRCLDLGSGGVFCLGAARLAAGAFGLPTLSGGRRLQEEVLRGRVLALPGVQMRWQAPVFDLLFDDRNETVVGVRIGEPGADGGVDLLADLVVDASGRGSRTPAALARHGWPVPPEDEQRIDLRYTTRRFRLPSEHDPGLVAIVQGVAGTGRRAAIALHEQEDRWVVALSAYGEQAPPRDLDGFRAFARALPRPEIGDLLGRMVPLDEGAHFRVCANRRNRYEELDRHPGGLVVLGDALCSFDPAFGQGMSVAAAHARSLGSCLRSLTVDGFDAASLSRTLPRTFFPRAAEDLAESWATVSRRYRQVSGRTPRDPLARMVQAYLRRLVCAATRDPEVARAFLRVAHLTTAGSSLFAPALIRRVLITCFVEAIVARPDPPIGVPSPPVSG